MTTVEISFFFTYMYVSFRIFRRIYKGIHLQAILN